MKYFLSILAGLAFGGAVAVYMITHPTEQSISITNGIWKANKEMDLDGDRLLTAQISLGATFALKPSEVIYMVADKDQKGMHFTPINDYVIKGNKNMLKARYWSITLYAGDHFLADNEIGRYGFNGNSVQYNEDGSFEIYVSQNEQPINWLPSGDDDRIFFVLRMYHPDKSIYENMDSISLPSIASIEE